MKKTNEPLLLKLLNERWRELVSQMPDKYRVPEYNAGAMERIRHAVQCVTQLDNSDPFAGPRMALYLEQGLEPPSEVLKECKQRMGMLGKQPRLSGLQEALAPVKRQIDEDKAWNQYRSKQYVEENAA